MIGTMKIKYIEDWTLNTEHWRCLMVGPFNVSFIITQLTDEKERIESKDLICSCFFLFIPEQSKGWANDEYI